MAKKKLVLSKKKLEELKGFEDVLDLFTGVDTEIAAPQAPSGPFEDHSVYDFLEREYFRLEKLDRYFGQQLPLLQAYPQTEGLIEAQKEERDFLLADLVATNIPLESPVNKFFAQSWGKLFQ
jgi:hypothetical protein